MKIGIATSVEKAQLTPDDQKLMAELRSLGADVQPLIWSAGNFSGLDAILIRSIWDYSKRYPEYLAWLEDAREIRFINSQPTLRWNSDKSYLLELARGGVSCVPSLKFARGSSSDEVSRELHAKGWGDVILKPTVSAGADLTFKVKAQDLAEPLRAVFGRSDALVQPYLRSVETEGEISLIFFNDEGPILSHAILKTPKSGDFRVQIEFGGAESDFTPQSMHVELARKALGLVQSAWTYARVDILGWNEAPMLGELEMIEPYLFMKHRPESYKQFASLVFKEAQRPK